MVPVPMTPDDALDTLPINAVSFQLLSHSLLDYYFPASVGETFHDAGSEVLVVFADAEVEEEGARGGVFD